MKGGIKIDKVFFFAELVQSIWAESHASTTISLSLKYDCTGITFCPYRLDQLLDQWPVDDSKQDTMPIFIFFIIFGYKDTICWELEQGHEYFAIFKIFHLAISL